MKNIVKQGLTLLTFLSVCSAAKAQSFVYHPVNPAFGGNYFNYSWMLNSAQAQDKSKDPASSAKTISSSSTKSTLTNFSQSLQQQLLSRITRSLVSSQFGEDSTLKEGTYKLGDFTVDVSNQSDGVYIRIVDNKGGETTVVVPYL